MAAIESLTTAAIIAMINAGAVIAPTIGTLNAVGSTVAVNVSQISNVAFHVRNVGTAADAAGVVIFEASMDSTNGTDGTWFTIQAARTNDNTIETGRAASSLAAGAAQAYGWEASVAGSQWFRIRQTTGGTASSSMQWTVGSQSEGSDPAPSVQTHAVTISGTPAVTISGTPAVTSSVAPAIGSSFQLIAAASINASVVKASAGSVTEITIFNSTAAVVYVKLYNKATTPAPATDSALLYDIFSIQPNARVGVEFGPLGKKYPAGIALATVANPALTDATAVAVGVTISATYV